MNISFVLTQVWASYRFCVMASVTTNICNNQPCLPYHLKVSYRRIWKNIYFSVNECCKFVCPYTTPSLLVFAKFVYININCLSIPAIYGWNLLIEQYIFFTAIIIKSDFLWVGGLLVYECAEIHFKQCM